MTLGIFPSFSFFLSIKFRAEQKTVREETDRDEKYINGGNTNTVVIYSNGDEYHE